MKGALAAMSILLSIIASMPSRGAETWQRATDKGVNIAVAGLDDGSFLGFFCAPMRDPRLAFITFKPSILNSPIPYDEKKMNLRFVIDDQRFDLPGRAEDREIYVEISDYNLRLRVDQVIAALSGGERATISIPTKHWQVDLPLEGARAALSDLMSPCE